MTTKDSPDSATGKVMNAGFLKFKTGKMELLAVTDGHSKFSPVQSIFAPLADADEVAKLLRDSFLPVDGVEIALNTLVIKKESEIIIFDTGCGHHFGPASGKLAGNLGSAGIEASAVTAVFLTHAHPDHIGGLTDKDGNLTYPNATVYISKIEYDFWTSAEPDFSRCKADKGFIGMMAGIARQNLEVAKDKLRFFNDGDILFGCVQVLVIPGHTPGHAISYIATEEGDLVHMGDITHDATLLLSNPEWGVVLDTDFETAGIARRKTLAQLAEGRKQIFSLHLPWPGLGHIRTKGDGFEWVPQAFMTPQLDLS
jgi:glyoxylase-like metal-dependent hydrolase (beta-lactamase superfamily II)